MASVGIMLLEMMLLSRIGPDRKPWRALFGLELPPQRPAGVPFAPRTIPRQFHAAGVVLLASAAAMLMLPERTEDIPARKNFTSFPTSLEGWSGREERMEQQFLDALMLDDYLLANYARTGERPVNFYVAWYGSQRAGRSAHSPRSCLPGGGWEIQTLTQVEVPGADVSGAPLRVNRAMIQLGTQKQLVYYWFQQRGRVITNEYLVKWYLFWDSLTRNRSDGALVRLVVPLQATESESEAERTLTEFAAAAVAPLQAYVPG
jgi:EpsI family protein